MSSRSPATILHKGRLEALSDAVFAVVLTLLVLDIKLDHLPRHASDAEVLAALHELSRPFLGYIVSFALAAIYWVLQDRKFSYLVHTTPRHATWTFGFLFGVSLVPFSVSVYLRSLDSGVASCLYFGTFAFLAAMLLCSWLDAGRSGLIDPRAKPEEVKRFTRRLLGMTLANTIGAIVAYFQPSYATTAMALVVVYVRQLTKPVPAESAVASAVATEEAG